MDAVIKETLRLFPPVAMLLRSSKEYSLVLPSVDGTGYYLPPYTEVIFSSLLIHRRRDLWGDSCDDFVPERWFDKNLLARMAATPFMYFPFHGGPRTVLIFSPIAQSAMHLTDALHSASARISPCTRLHISWPVCYSGSIRSN